MLYSPQYAQCLFENKMFKNIIDARPENVDDYLGTRFKYKCPFATCDNSSKNRMKTCSMHCAVFHNQLEVALAQYNTDGIEEVRKAVLHHRKLTTAPTDLTMPEPTMQAS